MIKELMQDLQTKLTTVAALSGKVGFQLGGTDTDPNLTETPLPYAWIIFGGKTPGGQEQGSGHRWRIDAYTFHVILAIGYGMTDVNFLTKLKIVEDAAQAVAGTSAISNTDLWEDVGAELKSVYPNRLVYQLSFSINGHHQLIN
jgi:hypothetical protein